MLILFILSEVAELLRLALALPARRSYRPASPARRSYSSERGVPLTPFGSQGHRQALFLEGKLWLNPLSIKVAEASLRAVCSTSRKLRARGLRLGELIKKLFITTWRKIKLQNSNSKLQINSKIQILITEANRFEIRLFEFGICLLFGACNL